VKNQETDPEEVLEEFADELEALREENDWLAEQVDQLEAEKANYQENLEVLRQQLGEEPEEVIEDIVEEETEPRDFDDVLNAVQKGEEDFGERIHIWSDAEDAAEESPFSRPNEVYEALGAIAELAELDSQDSATGPWDKFFEERGIKYAPNERQVTMGKYGDERIFHDRETDRRKEIQRHLTLGAGSREECVQIYFDREEGTDKFAVGYCGMHLQTEGWSS
jgi:DNA repair exonuclease SbcCD ATPase subunit